MDLDQTRKQLRGENFFDHNLTQVTKLSKMDSKLLWDLGEVIFSDVSKFNSFDKDSMIANFFPKWIIMECAIDYSLNQEQFQSFIGSIEYYKKCAHFYGSSMPEEKRLDDEDTIKIFSKFWDWHYSEIAHPIFLKKFDKIEYMAIFLLLLFDSGKENS